MKALRKDMGRIYDALPWAGAGRKWQAVPAGDTLRAGDRVVLMGEEDSRAIRAGSIGKRVNLSYELTYPYGRFFRLVKEVER